MNISVNPLSIAKMLPQTPILKNALFLLSPNNLADSRD
jgi:hypothetical protein